MRQGGTNTESLAKLVSMFDESYSDEDYKRAAIISERVARREHHDGHISNSAEWWKKHADCIKELIIVRVDKREFMNLGSITRDRLSNNRQVLRLAERRTLALERVASYHKARAHELLKKGRTRELKLAIESIGHATSVLEEAQEIRIEVADRSESLFFTSVCLDLGQNKRVEKKLLSLFKLESKLAVRLAKTGLTDYLGIAIVSASWAARRDYSIGKITASKYREAVLLTTNRIVREVFRKEVNRELLVEVAKMIICGIVASGLYDLLRMLSIMNPTEYQKCDSDLHSETLSFFYAHKVDSLLSHTGASKRQSRSLVLSLMDLMLTDSAYERTYDWIDWGKRDMLSEIQSRGSLPRAQMKVLSEYTKDPDYLGTYIDALSSGRLELTTSRFQEKLRQQAHYYSAWSSQMSILLGKQYAALLLQD